MVFEETFGRDEVSFPGFRGTVTQRFGKGFQVPRWVAGLGELGVGKLFGRAFPQNGSQEFGDSGVKGAPGVLAGILVQELTDGSWGREKRWHNT